ncbi:MAG TPA: glycosyltransferase family 4 protein [Gemmatimonadales bacterium]|nr:glycosyltransferase family 4 protein [Gemmatimonadales bacterium]
MTPTVLQVLHQGGGAGSVTSTLHLSLGLARLGMHVRFICPPNSEVESLARAGGLEVHPVALLPHRRRANAAALAEFLVRQPVDLINSQSARDREALTWLALTGRLRIPFVATRRQMPRTFVVENWLVGQAAAQVVAVSRAVGEALVRRGTPRKKLTVIPNGVVTDRLDVPVSTAALQQWKERIGWNPAQRIIGVMARPKDQHVVLRALSDVRTPVRLVLAGVEPGSSLADLAAKVPRPHTVVCLPFMSDVRPLYDLLELVLLPSRSEGLSQALLEAMALEKPVIASAATGNLEVLTDQVNGRLVAPLEAGSWALAINELLADPEGAARLAAAARHTARVTFALDHTVRRTARLYEEVLTRFPRPRTRLPGAAAW